MAIAVVNAAVRMIIGNWFALSVVYVPPTYGGRVGVIVGDGDGVGEGVGDGVGVGVGEGVGSVPLAYFKS